MRSLPPKLTPSVFSSANNLGLSLPVQQRLCGQVNADHQELQGVADLHAMGDRVNLSQR